MIQFTLSFPSVDPSQRLALANLRAFLLAEGDYSTRAINAIVAHVAAEGTVDDAPYIYPAEVDAITAAFVRGFDPVDQSSPEWGSPLGRESEHNPLDDVWTIDIDRDIPPAPDEHYATGDVYWRSMMADGITPLPSSSGGCLELDGHAGDRRDFESWLSSLDDGPPADQAVEPTESEMRSWYQLHPLSEFDALRDA